MYPPHQIGPFELLEKLGAGGMGEVFRARDTRLNRYVAMKFLPRAAGATARERFAREAQAIAALNHPNICTLYEAGEYEGQPYLVMELLEGETLWARLQRGPVGMPQTAAWGAEIADALAAAHAKGIQHRDLKPGNIFLTTRGSVKVLDFGLAQFVRAAQAEADAEAPTISTPGLGPLTAPGTTMGTWAYMSPEQARGESCDARSDLFSLGVVLYEMAAGKEPFAGRTTTDLAAAILKDTPPPPSTLQPDVPARLDDLIARCLEKDPGLRFQTAADLRASLRRLAAPGSGSGSGAALPAAARARRRRPAGLWAVAVVVVLAGGGAVWWRLRAPAALVAPPLSFRQLSFSGAVQDAAISPDGKFLAYVKGGAEGTSLHLLSTVNGSDTQIMAPAPGCCGQPSFSRDGSAVFFTSGRRLLALPVLGGSVRTIAGNACSGAGFSPDGDELAYIGRVERNGKGGPALYVARADGTQARVLRDPYPNGYQSACWQVANEQPDAPAWSPDGKWIAVELSGSTQGGRVFDQLELVSTADGHARALGGATGAAGPSNLAWLPDGSGILASASLPASAPSQVWEVSYPQGRRVALTHDLQGYTKVTLGAGGELALVHSNPQYSVWMQEQPGGAFRVLAGGGSNQDGSSGLVWTPEGRILTVHAPGGQSELWLEGDRTPPQQIAVAGLPAAVSGPQLGVGGTIYFNSQAEDGRIGVWSVSAQGTNLTELTGHMPPAQLVGLTSDGSALVLVAFDRRENGFHENLWLLPVPGGAARQASGADLYGNFYLPIPGSQRVLVVAVRGGVEELALDGAPPIPVRPQWQALAPPYGITADGRALTGLVTQGNASNIWAAPLDGSKPYALTHFADLRIAAYAFARDGRLAVSRGTANSDAVIATGLRVRR